MPKLKPTVPYAEKHSKAMSVSFIPGSKMEMRMIAVPITIKDRVIIANALLIDTSAISLLKTSTRDLPLARLIILSSAMAKVLVLIPPPVDWGEAPIHINIITNNSVGRYNAAVSMVLNPAVLGVVAPKRAVTILPKPLCSASVLLYSRIKNKERNH